ncbi:hypothetical protein ES703_46176 [subsurface metagenome]
MVNRHHWLLIMVGDYRQLTSWIGLRRLNLVRLIIYREPALLRRLSPATVLRLR